MQLSGQWRVQIARGFRANWLAHVPPAERFSAFLIAGSNAIFCFAAVMRIGTVDSAHKLQYYGGGLTIGLLVGVATALGVLYLAHYSVEGRCPCYYESLLIFNLSMMVFVALAGLAVGKAYTLGFALALIFLLLTGNYLIACRLANPSKKIPLLNVLSNQPPKLLAQITVVVLAVVALMTLALAGVENGPQWIVFGAGGLVLVVIPVRLHQQAFRYAPSIGFVLIAMFSIDQFFTVNPHAQIPAIVGGFIGVILLIRFLPDQEISHSIDTRFSWIDLLAIAMIFLLTFDLEFSSDRHHANAYLAAVNDIVHGKTLLVNTVSQYGWLLPYTFAALFSGGRLTGSYASFSLVNSFMVGATLSLVYLLLRHAVRSIQASVTGVLIMVVAYVWVATVKITYFPSTGPVRFIWLYVLVAVFAWETSQPSASRWLTRLKHLVLIVGIAWSIESALSCVVVFLALTAFELLVTAGEFWKRAFKQIVLLSVDIALVLIGVYGFTYLRSGMWPNWNNYLGLLLFYPSKSPIYLEPYFFNSRWLLIASVYLISLLLLVLKWIFTPNRSSLRHYTLVLGMTVLGLLQFVYWVGNSAIISSQSVPAIFLIIFWGAQLMRGSYLKEIQQGARYLACFFGTYFVILGSYLLVVPTVFTPAHLALQPIANLFRPAVSWKLNEQWNKRPEAIYVYPDLAEGHDTVAPALALITKYAADKNSVGVLIPPDSATEVLIAAQKTNIFPLDDAIIDGLLPSAMQSVPNSAAALHPGDIVFVDLNLDSMLLVQQAMAQNLCGRFSLMPLEASDGIAAIRLENLSNKADACMCLPDHLLCPDQAR